MRATSPMDVLLDPEVLGNTALAAVLLSTTVVIDLLLSRCRRNRKQ